MTATVVSHYQNDFSRFSLSCRHIVENSSVMRTSHSTNVYQTTLLQQNRLPLSEFQVFHAAITIETKNDNVRLLCFSKKNFEVARKEPIAA